MPYQNGANADVGISPTLKNLWILQLMHLTKPRPIHFE